MNQSKVAEFFPQLGLKQIKKSIEIGNDQFKKEEMINEAEIIEKLHRSDSKKEGNSKLI